MSCDYPIYNQPGASVVLQIIHCAAFENFFSKVKNVLTVSNLFFCAEFEIATRFL